MNFINVSSLLGSDSRGIEKKKKKKKKKKELQILNVDRFLSSN